MGDNDELLLKIHDLWTKASGDKRDKFSYGVGMDSARPPGFVRIENHKQDQSAQVDKLIEPLAMVLGLNRAGFITIDEQSLAMRGHAGNFILTDRGKARVKQLIDH